MSITKTKKIYTQELLSSLKKEDIYSLLLFALYKLKEDPQYTTLTELCYLLNSEDLFKFLRYYGGMTITIPSSKDLLLVLDALKLFQFANIDGHDFLQGITELCNQDNFDKEELKEAYNKICEVTADYDFRRE